MLRAASRKLSFYSSVTRRQRYPQRSLWSHFDATSVAARGRNTAGAHFAQVDRRREKLKRN